MDESRKAFESWCRVTRPCLTTLKNCDGKTYSHDKTQAAWKSWQASREEIAKGSIVAYQDPYGNAVSAGDFDGGEDEMHETAFQEGWTPLVRAAGIKVKE